MKSLTMLLLCSLVLGCSAPAEPESNAKAEPESNAKNDQEPSSSLAEFKADSKEFTQLGEAVQVGGYTISPPKGFVRREPNAPSGVKVVAWTGATRADGSTPMIQLMILTLPASEQIPKLDQAIAKMIAGVKRRRTNWTESDASYGMIGDIKFAKKTWSAKDQNSGTSMDGIMYVGIDGRSLIQLYTQDLESHKDSLKRGEASLLSFSK